MSVKKEPSGRRYVETQLEVPGTPEEVWQAIATGPGMSSWFMPTVIEERDGKPVAMKFTFSPEMEPRCEVTAWDPPRMFATTADGFLPGSPPMASEWTVEARAGGVCVLRIVQSLFASTDEWDNQLEGAQSGFSSFLSILRIYLAHFPGQRAVMTKWMAPASGTEAEAWDALTAALGVKGLSVGQRWAAPAGVPVAGGVVEYITQNPNDALVRLDTPGPGVAALGTIDMGGPVLVAMHLYQYGDRAAETVAHESPRWKAWFQERFPTPT